MIAPLLGLLLLSFFVTAVLLVPLIDYLYKVRLNRTNENKRLDSLDHATPITAKLLSYKGKRPIGAGILIVLLATVITFWSYGILKVETKPWELFILLFTLLSFAALGFYDDLRKNLDFAKTGFFGMRWRHKFAIQIALGLFIGFYFWAVLGYNFIHIHWFGRLDIGILFVPLAAFMVVAFANAYNITDGLDGLSTGSLVICLTVFLVLASELLHPSLALFLVIWIGSLLAFLYFNIYPARIELGDTGALAFGATLAVVGLLTGKVIAVGLIGGIFVVEAGSSLIQMLSKHFLGRKVFSVSPLHLWFMHKGWEEPKVVMRFWLVAALFSIFGLWLAVIG